MSMITPPDWPSPKSRDGEATAPQKARFWYVGTLTYSASSLVTLFFWLLWGDFTWSMRDRAIGPVAQFLLVKLGASDTLMATFLSSLPAAIGMLLGPAVSYCSDRHRGRWGRRIPFLLATAPIAALAMVGLTLSGTIGRSIHTILGLYSPDSSTLALLVFGCFWTCFECAAVVAGAVFSGLVNDVVPVQLLGRFYGLFRALSLAAGIAFNYWLLGAAQRHVQWLFGAIAILYGAGVMMMCFFVKEGQYPPPPDVETGHRKDIVTATTLYFKECFSNPYYIWIFLAFAFSTICFSPVNLYTVPYAQEMGVNMATLGKYLALTYAISLVLAYPLGVLVDRYHPLPLSTIVLGLYALVSFWGWFDATTPHLFAVVLIAHGVASGTYFTVSSSLSQRLLPSATYAQFNSAAGVVGQLMSIIAGPAFGTILDLSGHDYRCTFLMNGILTVLAFALMCVVFRQYARHGDVPPASPNCPAADGPLTASSLDD